MRQFSLVVLFIIISSSLFSQTPYRKKVYHKTTKFLVEEYDTTDSLSTSKIGYYARYNAQNGKMIKTGSFKENARTGIWSFYDDSAKLNYKYNYTSGMVLFSKPDTLARFFLKMANVDTNFYDGLESIPEFVGGPGELRDFLQGNLRYPAIAKDNEIEGYVIASFFIGSNGFPETPKIIKSIGYGCEEEVLRVVKIMPRWMPARRQGEVRQQYYMAFKFELKK